MHWNRLRDFKAFAQRQSDIAEEIWNFAVRLRKSIGNGPAGNLKSTVTALGWRIKENSMILIWEKEISIQMWQYRICS